MELLNGRPKKVQYFSDAYSRLHKGIIAHAQSIDATNVHTLSDMDFVFICVDEGRIKRLIFDTLLTAKVPFVDVGMGVHLVDGALTGSIRTTLASSAKFDHLTDRISLSDEAVENEYSANIQIAELNALNAAIAVIKWKKYFGYYHDHEREHNSIYDINVNKVINDDIAT